MIFFVLITWMSKCWAADVMFLVLTEKDSVQNPFVTAFEQGISEVQTSTSTTTAPLTFDHTVVVLDR
jgi:hypothetical protein